MSGSWWKGDFHNLTTTINQSWSAADYSPYTWYNPITGAAVHGLCAHDRRDSAPDAATSTPSIRSARTSTTPTTSRPKWRIPRRRPGHRRRRVRARAVEVTAPRPTIRTTRRRRRVSSTASACATTSRWIFPGARAARCRRPRKSAGASTSVDVVPEQLEPDQFEVDDGDARQHALPGELPVAVPGRRDHHADGDVRPDELSYTARARPRHRRSSASCSSTSRCASTFRFDRFQVLPTFEVFNINNSDAIISYITTNYCRRRTWRRTASCRAACMGSGRWSAGEPLIQTQTKHRLNTD